MTNTTATGGYISGKQDALPGSLTLVQFIQSVLVGLSGLPGDLVRPDWQVEPPKAPDLYTNWMAFGIKKFTPDTYSYVAAVNEDVPSDSPFIRQEGIEILTHFYGPLAMETASLVSDGFQLQQNLSALASANMGFTQTSELLNMPELVNERYRNRYIMSIVLRRQIQRSYPILQVVSARGAIHYTKGETEYSEAWQVEQES